MQKRYLLLILLLGGLMQEALAQASRGLTNPIQLSDLRTPSAPGFVLLGKAPAQVDRPSTPSGIATSLLGGLRGQDFALSAAPFWLVKHRYLTFNEYTSNNAKIDFRCFYRDADISLAVITDSLNNQNAGFGLRTNLFRVRQPLVRKNADILQQAVLDIAQDPTKTALLDTIKKYRPLAEQNVVDFENKPLLLVSLAGAYAYRLPEANRDGDRRRGGAWVDVAWHPVARLEVLGVARWQNLLVGQDFSEHENTWDFGGRLGGEFSLGGTRDWLFSGEYLRRVADSGSSYRLAVINEVEITENIYFTATFGEDFGNGRQTITLFGLNFGITTDSQLKTQEKPQP
jgi:hypothetical protein